MKDFKQGLRLFCSRCNIAKAVLYTFAIITVFIVLAVLSDGSVNPKDDVYIAYITGLVYYCAITISAVNNGMFNNISVRTAPYAKSCIICACPAFFAVSDLAITLLYAAAELIFRHPSAHLISDMASVTAICSIFSLSGIMTLNGTMAGGFAMAFSGFLMNTIDKLLHSLSIPAAVLIAALTAVLCFFIPCSYLKKTYGTKKYTRFDNISNQSSEKGRELDLIISGSSREVRTSRINFMNDYSLLTYSEPLALWKTLAISLALGAFIWAECFFNFGAPVPEILIFIIAITNMHCLINILKVSRSALTMKNRQKTDNFLITIPRIAERSVSVYLMLILYNVLTVFLTPAVGMLLCGLSGTEPSRNMWTLFICIFTGISTMPITSALKEKGSKVLSMPLLWFITIVTARNMLTVIADDAFLDTVFLITGIVISVVCFVSHAFKVAVTCKRKKLINY